MKITGKTNIYAIFGNPVEHSFSPVIQNIAFQTKKIDAVYVAFQVTDLKAAVQAVKAIGIKGLSITIPHKINIIPLLDQLDPLAKNIGAVNTVLNKNNTLIGYNTDGVGALKALIEVENSLENKKIAIIGCGGAARSIGFTLALEKPAQIEILTIESDYETGNKFAQEINDKTGISTQCHLINTYIPNYDILINATPVGMHPHEKACPLPEEKILMKKTVFDIIYTPKETLLIQLSKKKKCKIVYGYKMLLNQGLEQFKIWTGQTPHSQKMERELLKCLK